MREEVAAVADGIDHPAIAEVATARGWLAGEVARDAASGHTAAPGELTAVA